MTTGKAAVLAAALWVAGSSLAADDVQRGRYYYDPEVETFHPCGSKRAYWVVGNKATLQPLRERTAKLREARRKPYQPVYIEAAGRIDTVSRREGFAMDYDGLFRLRKVLLASSVVPKGCAR